jgi:hypothetical protein
MMLYNEKALFLLKKDFVEMKLFVAQLEIMLIQYHIREIYKISHVSTDSTREERRGEERRGEERRGEERRGEERRGEER